MKKKQKSEPQDTIRAQAVTTRLANGAISALGVIAVVAVLWAGHWVWHVLTTPPTQLLGNHFKNTQPNQATK
jgi:hypothetical protein